MSEPLLNCPFCGAMGGDLMLTFTRADGDAAWWAVECCQCDAEVINVENEAGAVIAWNTRTPPTVSEPDSKEGEQMAALTAERDRLKRFAEWCLSARYDGRNVGILARQALAAPEQGEK